MKVGNVDKKVMKERRLCRLEGNVGNEGKMVIKVRRCR